MEIGVILGASVIKSLKSFRNKEIRLVLIRHYLLSVDFIVKPSKSGKTFKWNTKEGNGTENRGLF